MVSVFQAGCTCRNLAVGGRPRDEAGGNREPYGLALQDQHRILPKT